MITVSNALENAARIGGKTGLNCIAGLIETADIEKVAAESAADSPLAGVPVLVKDNIDVAGFPTTAGSLALEDNLAVDDAQVIRNLRRNGAVIIGKTNLTEFANYVSPLMPCGYSSRGGRVIHAVSPDLNPLGSSTGSAVAVAAGIVPMAVGTDTCHSITACAWGNGICGLKPPAGVLSQEGIIPISKTLDSAGAMAMNMTDTIRLYSAMRDEQLPEIKPAAPADLRIAVNIAQADVNDDGKKAFLHELIGLLKANGAQIGEVDEPPALQVATIMKWEFKTGLEEYLRKSAASLKTLEEIVAFYEANPETMMKYGDGFLRGALDETTAGSPAEAEYLEAMEARKKAIRDVQDEISGYDAVLMTGPTSIMHFCGLPTVTVAFDRKDANGVRQTVILYGSDECRLYAAALAIEELVNR
ncbi:MAG: amidase [Lachnospiraceae bacterium]|nr:amidase [Lachnospiraceae bacterium]